MSLCVPRPCISVYEAVKSPSVGVLAAVLLLLLLLPPVTDADADRLGTSGSGLRISRFLVGSERLIEAGSPDDLDDEEDAAARASRADCSDFSVSKSI